MKTRKGFVTHLIHVLNYHLPRTTPAGVTHNLDIEIADRILRNAAVVINKKQLRDQVLIVLADYHDHEWVRGKLSGEATRLAIADRIMDGI